MGTAVISPCGTYRYRLSRDVAGCLAREPGSVLFIMLNPSRADADSDDPTVRKCVEFARRLGHDRLRVVNLFAMRATDPAALRAHADPVGPDNDSHVLIAAGCPGVVVCAWGTHGTLRGRDREVVGLLRRHGVAPMALGWTMAGHPRHPLYLRADAELVPFPEAPHA